MGHELADLPLRKTEFHLPDGRVTYWKKQALGSLYKEFIVGGMVMKFYLFEAKKDAFVYKYFEARKSNFDGFDKHIPHLLMSIK